MPNALAISKFTSKVGSGATPKGGKEAYLGGDYALIALQKNHRRKFNQNIEHQQLAKYLKDNEFISKYSEDDGMIKINARNI